MELTQSLLVGLGFIGIIAGFLGALFGIGGGVILVPAMVLFFGFDFKIAVACSLIAVVASSTASSSVFVVKGLTNMRLAMVLEIATTIGGIFGGITAVYVSSQILTGVFSLLMVFLAVLTFRKKETPRVPHPKDGFKVSEELILEKRDGLSGRYVDAHSGKEVIYHVKNLLFGSFVSLFAGLMSGLLGVGGGFLKVPAMNLVMGVPLKAASATSNFMIGVTAVSSLFVYLSNGYLFPQLAAPIVLGVVGGALFGAKVVQKIAPSLMRKIFSAILLLIGLQMLIRSFGGIW